MFRKLVGNIRGALEPLRLDWIQVEVSARCQGGCAYCAATCIDPDRGGLMERETFERLIPAFSNVDLVFLQGWGEPLLQPRLFGMVTAVKEMGTAVGFTTNAMALDEGIRKQVLDTGVDVLGISLAGATSETHDRLRSGGELARVDEYLTEFRAEREHAPLDLHIAYLLTRDTVDELPALVETAERWGVTEIITNSLTVVGDEASEEMSLAAHPERWPEVREKLGAAREAAEARGIGFHWYEPRPVGCESVCSENVTRSAFVAWDGSIHPCVVSCLAGATRRFEGREVPIESLAFGNLADGDFRRAWRSRDAKDFRLRFSDRIARRQTDADGLPATCRHCHKLRER